MIFKFKPLDGNHSWVTRGFLIAIIDGELQHIHSIAHKIKILSLYITNLQHEAVIGIEQSHESIVVHVEVHHHFVHC